MRAPLALLLLLHVLAPGAAHPGDEYDVFTAQEGDALAYVSPQAPVVKAGRDVALLVELVNASTGTRDGNLTLRAEGPGSGFEARVETLPGGRAARATFPSPGAWNLSLRGETMGATVRLDVYPESAYHLDSTGARYGLHYASGESRIPFAFVRDDSGALAAEASDAHARIEQVDANGTVLGSQEKALDVEAGAFVLAHEFGEAGTYLVRVRSESIGIGYDDLPPAKVQMRPGRDPDAPQETPGPALILGLAALVLVALAKRRG